MFFVTLKSEAPSVDIFERYSYILFVKKIVIQWMILVKTSSESIFFSVFYHHLKFWTLKFNAPWLLQKTFTHHGFLFNNVYLHAYYHPSTFVGLVAKYPLWMIIIFLIKLFIVSLTRVQRIKQHENHRKIYYNYIF